MGDRFTELQLKLKSLAGDAAKGLLNEVDSALSIGLRLWAAAALSGF